MLGKISNKYNFPTLHLWTTQCTVKLCNTSRAYWGILWGQRPGDAPFVLSFCHAPEYWYLPETSLCIHLGHIHSDFCGCHPVDTSWLSLSGGQQDVCSHFAKKEAVLNCLSLQGSHRGNRQKSLSPSHPLKEIYLHTLKAAAWGTGSQLAWIQVLAKTAPLGHNGSWHTNN